MFIFKKSQSKHKHTVAMDDTISFILKGCKLSEELHSSLPNIANQPNMLLRSCEEIIKTFSIARERLNAQTQGPVSSLLYPQMMYSEHQLQNIDPGLQEWLRCNVTQAMENVIQTQILGEQRSSFPIRGHEMGERDHMEATSTRSRSTRGDVLQAMDVSESAGRSRHRRSENARTVMVPAPRIGNTEIPPEDGYTWRKYGQKEILNSRFPRSYYRCTHQKLYQCPAKKQVQRLDDDPTMFEVTYNGEHTCHMSSTAPSSVPAAAEMTQEMSAQTIAMQPSQTSLGGWLSMEVGAGGSGSSSMVGGYSSGGGRGGDAGPSTIRCDKDGDQYLQVANMADAMFNSGSSSSNSMEFLFSSHMDHDKWQPEDKKD